MKLLILLVIGNLGSVQSIYFNHQDSLELNNKRIQIQSDQPSNDYEFELYKENDIFHLNILSKKEQKLHFKFQRFCTQDGHSIHYKSFMSNEVRFSLEESEYHYQLAANQIERGTYECSISPGYEIEFFHVYNF